MKGESMRRGARFTVIAPAILMLACAAQFLVSPRAAFASGDKVRSRAEHAMRDGEYDLAEKLYRELLARDSGDNNARLGLSYTLLKQRRLQDAYDHAARVIAAEPLSPRAHALLGSVLLAGGDFRLSIEEFRTALSLREDEPLAVAGLAMVDYFENRLDACMRGLRRATFLDPDEPDFIFDLAQAASRAERYKEAADAYERFLQVAPRTDTDRRDRILGLISFLRYLGVQSGLYSTSGASRVSLPFLPSSDGRPVVEVRINDNDRPLRFVLDTGSGMCVISDETAARLGVRPVARGGLARAVGGGGRFEIVYGYLNSVTIGDARISNVPVYIRRFYDDGSRVDGFIGLSVISHFVATVDYGSRQFSLSRNGTAPQGVTPVGGAIEIPMRTTASGFLSGEVLLDGLKEPLNFIIDTGASVTVVAEKLAAREELSEFEKGEILRVFGAAGVADAVRSVILPRIRIGSIVRERVSAAILDMDPINETTGFAQGGIIGGNVWQHFRMVLDFQRSAIRLEPLEPARQEMPAGEKRAQQPAAISNP